MYPQDCPQILDPPASASQTQGLEAGATNHATA